MVQILDRPYDPGSAGSGIQRGIQSGLQTLADARIKNKLKKETYSSQLEVARALGLPNAEGLAHADPDIFAQVVKKEQPVAPGSAFSNYINAGQGQQQGGGIEALQQGMQQQQGAPLSKEEQEFEDYANSPEAQKALGPENINKLREYVKQQLGGQGGQAQQQSQRPNEQQLYEQALGGATPHQRNIINDIRESRNPKASEEPKWDPVDLEYAKNIQDKSTIANEIEPILEDIEAILSKGPYSSGNPQGYNTGYLESISPVGLLKNTATQDLNNAISKLVVKKSQLEGQGRSTDNLRSLIQASKLSLGQTPESLNNSFQKAKKENEKDILEGQALQQIRNNGGPVKNLSQKIEQAIKKQVYVDEAGNHWRKSNGKFVRVK